MGRYLFDLELAGPLASDEAIAATVALSDGRELDAAVVGRRLRFSSEARPVRIWFSPDEPVHGALHGLAEAPTGDGAGVCELDMELASLFERGCGAPIPRCGRLRLTPLNTSRCVVTCKVRRTRRDAAEHERAAEFVGFLEVGSSRRFSVDGTPVELTAHDALPLGDRGLALRFGLISALAGDYYATLEADDLKNANVARNCRPYDAVAAQLGWDPRQPALAEDDPEEVRQLVAVLDAGEKAVAGKVAGWLYDACLELTPDKPLARYLALEQANHAHFANFCGLDGPHGHNHALDCYWAYHRMAIERAVGAQGDPAALSRVLATEAFAGHFLADMFAAGHLRPPRGALAERHPLKAYLWSKQVHDEDNERGLWVWSSHPAGPSKRTVWKTCGHGDLQSAGNEDALFQVQRALWRSSAEVYTAFYRRSCQADALEGMPRAEDLLPTPLPPGVAPGQTPGIEDVDPHGHALSGGPPNSYPRHVLDQQGELLIRCGGPDENSYKRRGSDTSVLSPVFGRGG